MLDIKLVVLVKGTSRSIRGEVTCLCIGQFKVERSKSVAKGTYSRGNQGQPGPAYPTNSLAHINPTGDLPSGGTARRGQGQEGSN